MRNDKTQLDDWSMYTAKSKWAKVRKTVQSNLFQRLKSTHFDYFLNFQTRWLWPL